MEYPNIIALVPSGEHFDAAAMNDEGIWLTPGHVSAIEVSLTEAQTQSAGFLAQIEDMNAQVNASSEKVNDLEATVGHRDAEIERLNAEIVELKKAPAGGFSTTTKDSDEGEKTDPKSKYFQSSWNQEAAKYAK